MTLSDRIAAATGPDRALDAEINDIILGPDIAIVHWMSSIQAAFGAIPNGHTYGMGQTYLDGPCWAWVAKPNVGSWRVTAPTIVQAILAASMKARGL